MLTDHPAPCLVESPPDSIAEARPLWARLRVTLRRTGGRQRQRLWRKLRGTKGHQLRPDRFRIVCPECGQTVQTADGLAFHLFFVHRQEVANVG